MKRYLLPIVFVILSVTALAQDCSQDELASFHDVKNTVLRLLSFPGYTGWDEKTLNRSGDLAAIGIMRSVTIREMDSPAKARQILLILHLAFEAPQLIADSINKTPTATMLLLDELEHTKFGQQPNVINNSRFEIQHNASTGRPLEFVTMEGSPVVDQEHTQWVGSVLAWTADIKPGMTRKDLLKVFTTEGGLSTRTQQTYVLKQCPLIKVDVEFLATANKQDQFAEMPEDKIIKISKPYLDYSRAD
jgi:hypothetical protein